MKVIDFTTFLGLIAALLSVAGAAGVARADETKEVSLLSRIHSHNDYQQKHPLYDAMDQGLSSVEADIYTKHGDLEISHMGFRFKGTLEELYLKPLQKLVNERGGSVYGDGRPFILWIDIKENEALLETELANILDQYPMLTEFTDTRVVPGAVTVILTGKTGPKTFYANHTALRHACRDSKTYNDQDPPADLRWTWYSLKWEDWMGDEAKLSDVVARIHSKGRKVRLWDVPKSEAVWRESLKAGVDLVGADDLPRVRKFVDKLSAE